MQHVVIYECIGPAVRFNKNSLKEVNVKIKTKLTVGSLLMALIPVITMAGILGWMSIKSSHETIQKEAMLHLVAVRENNKSRIEGYFNQIRKQSLTFANDRMIIDAMTEFKLAVDELEVQVNTLDAVTIKKQLDNYYTGQFAPEYSKQNHNKSISPSGLLASLDPTAAYLQNIYIQENSNPLGSKNDLNAANDGSRYSQVHGLYHKHINDYLKKFGYYDIFLVDPDSGRIIYSVYKELDYATSLTKGAYANSGLGIAFQRANQSNKAETFLEDFKPYTPSYEGPASFIATPIFEQGKKIGVLVFQMPIDEINFIMTSNKQWKSAGMGDSGESYIVGSDSKTRSLSRFLIEDKAGYVAALANAGVSSDVLNNIKAKDTNIGLQSVNSAGSKAALSGQTGEAIFNDYRNIPVLSAYAPLNIQGVKWAILTEIDEEEAFAPANELEASIISIAAITVLIVGVISAFIGFIFSHAIATPMVTIASAMKGISEGEADLTQRLDDSHRDEIGDIAHYFNTFITRIQDVVGEVSQYSVQLAAASEQVSVTAVQTNGNVSNQQMQIEQVATAMNEMTATVHDVARSASLAAEEAKKGDHETVSGGHVIEQTIEAINQLNGNISNASQTVTTLEEDGQSIGTVLDVIRGIAEQTNLLALNAAIEAARAGEQGRGFAVVADEVRTLASRTQDSTEEIQSMIEKLQHGTKDSAGAMAASVKLAEEAVNQAHGGTDALHNITEAIGRIDDMAAQIASASEEQSAVAEEINRSITSISDSARDTVTASDESSRAGESMAKLASDLTEVIQQFKF